MPRPALAAHTSDRAARTIAVEAYRRIIKAAEKGRGCHLSQNECIAISLDDAPQSAVASYDEENEK